jgi:hypothetical protein
MKIRRTLCLFLSVLLAVPAICLAAGIGGQIDAAGSTEGREAPENEAFPADSEDSLFGAAPALPNRWAPEQDEKVAGADSSKYPFVADSAQQHADTGSTASSMENAPAPSDSNRSPSASPDTAALAQSLPPPRPPWLYSGISLEQDQMARRMIGLFYNFDWGRAEKAGKKLQRLEKKSHLPPLSYLLIVGMRVFRLQNGEFEDERAKKGFLRDMEKLSKKGLELAYPEKAPDSLLAIELFISGGIKGFIATLEIDKNPIAAARNGFAAQRLLERAVQRDTSLYDAFVGLGLFNCVLAKAPLLVRGALNLIGKDCSLERGLDFLRLSAYRGCYTNEIAKLYLIQFLSPYLGNEAKEKNRILRSLEVSYPGNPYFLFLEVEEDLCFYPKVLFNFSFTERIERQIGQFKTIDYSTARYANLVKWQYLLMNPFPAGGIAPDTTFNLRGFSYYPAFLRALKEKFLYEGESSASKRDRARRLHFLKAQGAKALHELASSPDMPLGLKGQFLWHIRDGLRMERK